MPLIETPPDAVCKIYAKALFDSVRRAADPNGPLGVQNAVEETLGQLQSILEMARSDKRFGEFLSSRIIDRAARGRSIGKVLDGKAAPYVVNFIKVLNDNDRLSRLPGIVDAFDAVAQESFGRVEVNVTTAEPMGADARAALESSLHAKLGKTPVLHCKVEPSILGGIRIQVGDQLVDASLSTRLGQVRQQMAERGGPAIRAAAQRLFNINPSMN
jgi:ATP synthase F1 delta subunit